MKMMPDRRLLARLALAVPLVLTPFTARAADDAGKKPAAAATSPSARTKEQILKDLEATGNELREVMSSKGGDALGNADKRQAIAPKALPLMHKYLAIFDELTEAAPRVQAQSASVHAQYLSMMMALGDPDAEGQLKKMAAGNGEAATQAKTALLVGTWWRNSGNEAEQRKVVDQLAALMKADPNNDGTAASIVEMANVGAASPAVHDAAEQVVIDNAKGDNAEMMIEQIQSARKLKQMEGKPIALAGPLLDGHPFTTADWKGKVVLVDIWATWCVPCREELPHVKKLYDQYHAKGLEVVGVSCDDTTDDLKKFQSDNKDIPWPQMFDEKNPGWNQVAKDLGVLRIPTMFLIDKKGVLRSSDAQDSLDEMIPKLLAE
jgi:thiol-disulfide isomerase/thioredoxin